MQVINKACVGESKHAFILGSMVYMVANKKRLTRPRLLGSPSMADLLSRPSRILNTKSQVAKVPTNESKGQEGRR